MQMTGHAGCTPGRGLRGVCSCAFERLSIGAPACAYLRPCMCLHVQRLHFLHLHYSYLRVPGHLSKEGCGMNQRRVTCQLQGSYYRTTMALQALELTAVYALLSERSRRPNNRTSVKYTSHRSAIG